MNIKVIFIPVFLLAIQPSNILSDGSLDQARADLDKLHTESMMMGMVLDPSGQKYVSKDSNVQSLLKDYVNTGLDGGYMPGQLTENSLAIIRNYSNANISVAKVEGTGEKSDDLSLSDFQMVRDPLTGWTDITEQRRLFLQDPTGSSYLKIRKAMYYTRKGNVTEAEILSSKRVVLFLIHGTFAYESAQYSDANTDMYLAIMDYAATLGDVELVSINWSGGNTDRARDEAVNYMKFIFEKLYGKQNIFTQVNLLAHSHGGNIMNKMTSDSYFRAKIHNMFSIYTPVREGVTVNLDAITGQLYHFYSTADLVQYTGSYQAADFSTDWFGARKLYTYKGGRKATQITQEQGVSEQKALNYRVQFDGYSPSHTNILPILLYLGDIVNTTKQYYQYQSDFDLNIDTRNRRIDLAIRRTYPDDVINQVSEGIRAQLQKETAYSNQQEDAYKKTYGSNIHDKSKFRETIQGTYDMLRGR